MVFATDSDVNSNNYPHYNVQAEWKKNASIMQA